MMRCVVPLLYTSTENITMKINTSKFLPSNTDVKIK
jgi:hypothetical protein